ncbi:transcriptional regulator, HxlR family [Chryseolinea serpens]|uniref:Transcriptional regulator, HxlR family n=1 Tax=Chryseolinea serpens TaxID=947013 RepID=A0A1M5UKH7_9BACT|nr:helix-turn-helix domain-containing protein [Chryseolinea serpens]SHH63173.1 transcriptional regulator, HxlR family [Chryseolinea serpens]
MATTTYDASICMMTRIFEMIGGKWKPIILYLIQHDINRFGALQRSMPRISKKVLTEQLRELEQDQLLVRHIVVAHPPQIIEYHLTSTGVSLRQLLDDMVRWGTT